MKSIIHFLQVNEIKIRIVCILVTIGFVFNGCTALQEAQKRREERLLGKRNTDRFMLSPSDAKIDVDPDPITDSPHGVSDHYTLTFAKDLLATDAFDESEERAIFAQSALGYMESLYDAMYEIFGFKPKHKIHVTLHQVFRGTTLGAFTTTEYRYAPDIKYVTGIKMDFPMMMYEKHGVRVHELTHAFTNIYFLPTWFSEGIAVLMQTEYAKGGLHPKFDNLKRSLELDLDGFNELENWGGHAESGPLTQWRYSYAYTVVSELRKKYGNDLYIKVFALMEADQLHQKLGDDMPTSFLVYYISKAAGEDLVPFFKELKFKVRKLEKSNILEYIQQLRTKNRRRN